MAQRVIIPERKAKTIGVLPASVMGPYLDSIKSYNSPKARETLGRGNNKVSIVDDEFAGSSPLIQLQLLYLDEKNPGLFPNQTRPSTREDLEEAISQDSKFLKGKYTDFGLALITAGDTHTPNDYLAKTLAKQLKDREIKLGKGKLIYFSALAKREDSDSAYGLVLDLRDLSAKELEEHILDLNQFNWDFTRDEGLSSTCLHLYRGWGRYDRCLDYSYSGGRVVGVGDNL
jgi:hypothetical protein